MKHISIHQHLFQLIEKIITFKDTTEWVLLNYFRKNKNLGKQDRFKISETVYTLLRNREKILGFLNYLDIYTLENEILLAFSLSFPEYTYQTPFSIQDFLSYCQQTTLLHEKADLPTWIIQLLLIKYHENEIIQLGQALQNKAPLDIRTNTLKIKRNQLINLLLKHNILGEITPYSPWAIRLKNHPNLKKHSFYINGYFEIQDEGSQMIAYLSQAKKNQLIIDFCAGGGGKALALGSMLNNQGSIYAFDIEPSRLNQIKPRAERAGIHNIFPILIAHEKDPKLIKFHQRSDIVLVDAPCSGLGTLRRQPDLKYRNTQSLLTLILKKQISILEEAAKLCTSNGKLIYSTCSILPQENELLIQNFINRHPNFSLINCHNLLSGSKIAESNDGINFNPILTNTDGYYIAIMQKE